MTVHTFPGFNFKDLKIDTTAIDEINGKFGKQTQVIVDDVNSIIVAEQKRQRKVKIIKAAISGAVIGLVVALVVKRS